MFAIRGRPFKLVFITVAVTLLAGCAFSPEKPTVSDNIGYMFPYSIEKVQKAAIDALIVLGFEIKTQRIDYVEGFRPRKIKLFTGSGSGGETAGVWLESKGAEKTRVLVDTSRSVVGILGQKNWNGEIITEINKALGEKRI